MLYTQFSLVVLEAKPKTYLLRSYISATHLHNYCEFYTKKKKKKEKKKKFN